MTADGWRPIIGTRRQPTFKEEITHYRNPLVNDNLKKAETLSTAGTTLTTPSTTQKIPTKANNNAGGSLKKFSKHISVV